MIKRILWNQSQNRLRSGWRIVIQMIIQLAVLVSSCVFVSYMALKSGVIPGEELSLDFFLRLIRQDLIYLFVVYLVYALSVLVSVWLAVRFLDRRRFRDLGLGINKKWWLDFSFGFCLSAVLTAGIFIFELCLGWIKISNTFQTEFAEHSFAFTTLLLFVMYAIVGFCEELTNRGYYIKNLAEGLNFSGIGQIKAIYLAWLVLKRNAGSKLVSFTFFLVGLSLTIFLPLQLTLSENIRDLFLFEQTRFLRLGIMGMIGFTSRFTMSAAYICVLGAITFFISNPAKGSGKLKKRGIIFWLF